MSERKIESSVFSLLLLAGAVLNFTLTPPAMAQATGGKTDGAKDQADQADTDDSEDSADKSADTKEADASQKKGSVAKTSRGSKKIISEQLAQELEKGYKEMQDGKYSSAVDTLSQAVKSDNDSISARRYLAFALVKAGHPVEALEQLNTITKMIKATNFEWCTYGEAYLAAGGYDQAETCYKEALKSAPESDYARSGLIRTAMLTGKSEDSMELAKEGMKKSKNRPLYDYYKKLYEKAYLAEKNKNSAPVASASTTPAEGAEAAKQAAAQPTNTQQQLKQAIRRITSTRGGGGGVRSSPGG